MCMYCFVADGFFKDQNPPVWPTPVPFVPLVPTPSPLPDPQYVGWPIERLRELLTILEGIKKLEDTMMKCPCEPAKADYVRLLKGRIEALEMGLDICPTCKRWYAKPAATSHTRVKCLEVQLEDAREEANGQLQASATTAGTSGVQNVQAAQAQQADRPPAAR